MSEQSNPQRRGQARADTQIRRAEFFVGLALGYDSTSEEHSHSLVAAIYAVTAFFELLREATKTTRLRAPTEEFDAWIEGIAFLEILRDARVHDFHRGVLELCELPPGRAQFEVRGPIKIYAVPESGMTPNRAAKFSRAITRNGRVIGYPETIGGIDALVAVRAVIAGARLLWDALVAGGNADLL